MSSYCGPTALPADNCSWTSIQNQHQRTDAQTKITRSWTGSPRLVPALVYLVKPCAIWVSESRMTCCRPAPETAPSG